MNVEKKFAGWLGGAILAGVIDGAVQAPVWYDPSLWGTFPYVPTLEPLPPADDWIFLGISMASYAIGVVGKNENAKTIGEGMLGYSVPMIIGNTIKRAVGMLRPAAAVGLPAGAKTAPKFIPSVLMPKYQYGGNPGLAVKASLAGGVYPRGYVTTRPGETAAVGARPAITVGPYAGGITAPKFIPGVLRPKYQHGA